MQVGMELNANCLTWLEDYSIKENSHFGFVRVRTFNGDVEFHLKEIDSKQKNGS